MRKYVYTLKSNLLDKVITYYIDYVSNEEHEWRQKKMPTTNGHVIYNDGEGRKSMPLRTIYKPVKGKEVAIQTLPKPRYKTAKGETIAVTDILYRYYLDSINDESESEWFTVSSKYLKKASNNYYYILRTLYKMRQIDIDKTVKNERHERILYRIIDEKNFHLQSTSNIENNAKKSIIRIDEYATQRHREKLEKVIQATSATFVERYNKSLIQLSINKDKALERVNEKYKTKKDSRKNKARKYTIHKITSGDYTKEIRAIDDNGRIYHIGTEIQKDIREFTNIQYIIDCKNSHPFLFSYLLLSHIIYGTVNIEEDFSDDLVHKTLLCVLLYLKENKGIYNHYTFSDFVNKSLENRKLQKNDYAKIYKIAQSFAEIQNDVWQYIYDVSEGKIWDLFVRAFNEDRTTVKQQVFASVMYSYPSKRRKKLDAERAKWVNMFSKLYPNVYSIIGEIKQSISDQCRLKGKTIQLKHPHIVKIGNYTITYTKKEEVLLPTLLMKLESKIFIGILTKLFNKRICCFGIHDAVAVIKSSISVEQIQDIMMKEYAKYGLVPTLSVDYYTQ